MQIILLPFFMLTYVLSILWQLILLPFALLYAFCTFIYLGIMMIVAKAKGY